METPPDSTKNFLAKSENKFKIIIEMINKETADEKKLAVYISAAMQEHKNNQEFGFWKLTDEEKMTLLMHIAKINKKYLSELIAPEILIRYLYSVDETDKYNNTALMHAAKVGNIEILPCLKKYNALTNIRNQDNKTTLMLAVQHGHKKFIENMFELEFNISMKEQEELLLLAAGFQRTAIVEFLLSKGVNPFTKDTHGNTPLMLANSKGDYETASLLRKQYPVKRQIFTMACLGRRLEEAAETFPEGCIKKSVKHSGYLIKTAMYYLHNTANTQQLITLTFSINSLLKKFNEFIPHVIQTVFLNIETLFVGIECEKHVMNLFYVKSNNPNDILIEQNTLNTSRTRVPIPPLNLGGTALPTRSSGYQTPRTSLVSGDNNIEHLTPSLLETTEQDQENFNDPGELNEGARTSEDAFLKLCELEAEAKIAQGKALVQQGEVQKINAQKARKRSVINSPRRQETASTQSAGTSSRSSIPRLRLPNSSTTGTNGQLPHRFSTFPSLDEQASSSNHQGRQPNSVIEWGSLPRIDDYS